MAGFTGVETGGKFPKTSKELKPILDDYETLCVEDGIQEHCWIMT